VPTGFVIVVNGILFMFIRKSTSRLQVTGGKTGLSGRDARLLKHMIFIIAVYLGSWAPIYIVALADVARNFPPIVYGTLSILPNFGLLIGTIDLFLFNNQVKQMVTRVTLSSA
jgi:hypothetical protein